jgi:hypothetical protein
MLCDIVTKKNLVYYYLYEKTFTKWTTSSKVGREFKGESRGFGVLKIENFENLNLDSFWCNYIGSEVIFSFSCLKRILLMILNESIVLENK